MEMLKKSNEMYFNYMNKYVAVVLSQEKEHFSSMLLHLHVII